MNNDKPELENMERAALADLWSRVAIDDDAHPDDRAAARRKLSAPALTNDLLSQVEPWRLRACASILSPEGDEYTEAIKKLVGPR